MPLHLSTYICTLYRLYRRVNGGAWGSRQTFHCFCRHSGTVPDLFLGLVAPWPVRQRHHGSWEARIFQREQGRPHGYDASARCLVEPPIRCHSPPRFPRTTSYHSIRESSCEDSSRFAETRYDIFCRPACLKASENSSHYSSVPWHTTVSPF